MKKISGSRKFKFDNPIDDLLDLYLLLSRQLNATEIWISRYKYSFQIHKLKIDWRKEQVNSIITETLTITQHWQEDISEELQYRCRIEDQMHYQRRERKFLKEILEDDPELLQEINQTQEEEQGEPFLDSDSFLDHLEIVQLPTCSLTYKTSQVSQGLQSLAQLKLPTTPNNQADSVFTTVFESMLQEPEVEKELSRRLGEFNRKGQIKFLQTGKLSCSQGFQTTLEDTAPPFSLGYRILDLCSLYCSRSKT
jgi:hypothetical protein